MSSYDTLTREDLIQRLEALASAQQRHTERQEMLTKISRILVSSFDDETTLQNVAQLTVPILADWCSVLLLDEQGWLRRITTTTAFPDTTNAIARLQEHFPAPPGTSRVGQVLISGQSDLMSDIDETYLGELASSAEHRQAFIELGTTSMIRAPLLARRRTLGVILAAYGRSGRRYTPEDVPLIEDIAHNTALAIENAHLFQSAQRRLVEIATIQRVASLINSSTSLDTIFQQVVETINEVFGYRLISIYLINDSNMYLQAACGYEHVLHVIGIGQGVSSRVIRSGQAIFVRDADQDPDFLKAIPSIRQGIHVPLKRSNVEVIGLLNIESENLDLTDADLAILLLVADQISVAIANASLFSALRDSERRYRTLVEQAADAIVLTDRAWRITDMNSQACQLFGHPREALVSMYLPDLRAPEPPISWPPRHGSTFAITRNDHRTTPVEVSISTLLDQDQFNHIVILRDISERLMADQLQRATERRLLDAQRLESLGVLAGGIAHDFNNLLMAIAGNASLAALDLPTESPIHENLVQIEIATRRATELTQQMLAYAGKAYARIQPISLRLLVEELLTLLRATLQRQISIDVQINTNLPTLQADRAQIRQMITNLITNAAEAIGEGPGTITITITTRQIVPTHPRANSGPRLPEGTYIAIIITDTGPGIEPTLHQRIFEPFFTTKFAGRGLGLAAAQGIARSHGGSLEIESRAGPGARFIALLPAHQAHQAIQHEIPPRASITRASGAILVVDDEQAVRSTAASMIAQIGLIAHAAASGQDALQFLLNPPVPISAVLLDLTMPIVSGAETYSLIRSAYPDLPIILMSGYPAQEAIGQLNSQDQPSFLQKPFSLNALRTAIAQVLPQERV